MPPELLLQLQLRDWVSVSRESHSIPPPSSLTELKVYRQPKGQPRPATSAKPSTNGAATRGGRVLGRGTRRGRNAGRAKPKTADELDAEMVDYFDVNGTAGADGAATTNGTTQSAANGGEDLGMDEISVGATSVCILQYANHLMQ